MAISLARQNTLLLAAAIFLVEMIVVAAMFIFLLIPIGKRTSDDLAGLMVLSAQTWAELSGTRKITFEKELLASHSIALNPQAIDTTNHLWRPPYVDYLEEALSHRLGHKVHLIESEKNSQTWFWANLPAGHQEVAIGITAERISVQPVSAILISVILGLLMAMLVAQALAKRVTAPLAKFDNAVVQLGKGRFLKLQPDKWPSELQDLADRFNAMSAQIDQLMTARTTLLAGISHDLRTPLSRMLLALEMLKKSPSEQLINRMETDISVMSRLISSVLDIARGLQDEKPTEINVLELFSELAEQSGKSNRISLSCPESCTLQLPAHSLRRALSNLLENALRYSSGPIELVFTASERLLHIGVLDRGPGIPPEQTDKVLLPFARLENSRSPMTGGSGLGLAIVHELAKANHWEIRLNPRINGGLEAWLDIENVPINRWTNTSAS